MLNLLTRVRYIGVREGGVSHFAAGQEQRPDQRMHTRLVLSLFRRLVLRRVFLKRSSP